MIFNSFQFLWMFPIIFTLYYGVNSISSYLSEGKSNKDFSRLSNYLLLIISYLLYILHMFEKEVRLHSRGCYPYPANIHIHPDKCIFIWRQWAK